MSAHVDRPMSRIEELLADRTGGCLPHEERVDVVWVTKNPDGRRPDAGPDHVSVGSGGLVEEGQGVAGSGRTAEHSAEQVRPSGTGGLSGPEAPPRRAVDRWRAGHEADDPFVASAGASPQRRSVVTGTKTMYSATIWALK